MTMLSICSRRDFLKKGLLALPALTVGVRQTRGATVKRFLPPVDLDFISSRMELIQRSKWTDATPKTWILREAENYDRLTFHHEGNATNFSIMKNAVAHDLSGILAGHMERHYGDIGYHFIVDYAGRVWEGRSLAYEGAHVSGQNEGNIGVVLLGNFQEQEPSTDQLTSMKQIACLLQERYGIKKYRLYGHCDLGRSVCPGMNLYPYVVRLKGELGPNFTAQMGLSATTRTPEE